ncbi:7-carboxy-7-deazaguanine synthase QueE [Weeksella virosa]|uniref:7-carboxy-7-deazaguanine synthase QueE n=1 Tax=Weeksella virosa TaxID=1014 RepID=UPI0039C765DF
MIQISGITNEQQQLANEGRLLPVMEHFYTLQGEGAYAGVAAYFIRLGGCDVGCHWCDVKESWDAEIHPLTDIATLAKEAAAICKTIIITGGEPLMWDLTFLTSELHKHGVNIHIETSGAYPLTGEIDWVTLSPKKTKLPVESIYQQANELKMIIYNQHDFTFAEEQAAKVKDNCLLYLQVEWSKRDSMSPKLVEFIKQNPKWRITVQTHKYLDIP